LKDFLVGTCVIFKAEEITGIRFTNTCVLEGLILIIVKGWLLIID
jgi:hypothetical protein